MKLLKTLSIVTILLTTSLSEASTLKASFYAKGFIGKKTASGEVFRPNKATAASNKYKFGTIIKLSYKGQTTNVCINDTGGFGKYHRDLDVSKSVATKLNFIKTGVAKVQSSVVYQPKKRISCQKAWSMYASL